MAPSEPAFLKIDLPEPHRLAYRTWGNSTNDAVLCAHGLSRNSHDFDFLAEVLVQKGFYVIAADMPGRGDSSYLQNSAHYNNAVYVNDIKILLDQTGIEKVHWVGTSMGGAMAMLMEAAYPGYIRSLVLNDIGCMIPAQAVADILAYLGSERPKEKEALKSWLVRNWESFDVPGTRQELYWQHLFTYYLREDGNGGWRLSYDPNITLPLAGLLTPPLQDADFSEFCKTLAHIPTLLIRGGKSDLLTQAIAKKTQALWNADTPFEEYIIPTSGHAPMLMRDAEIARVCEWIERFRS